jgi:hypothetical protein
VIALALRYVAFASGVLELVCLKEALRFRSERERVHADYALDGEHSVINIE